MSQSNVTPQTFAALARQAMITSTLFSSILNRYRVGPEERRARALQTRAEHVANGELPGSSRHPHAVPIGFSMVSATPYTDFASAYSGPWFPVFDLPVEDALEATVGENECQSASKKDPLSASKRDPLRRAALRV
ncbi:hypothetical protein ACH0BU_17925, partial [Sphingomonas olei]